MRRPGVPKWVAPSTGVIPATPRKDGSVIKLNFDDWFYMVDDRGCVVRGTLGRLGLPFAVAHVSYRKL